MRVVLGVLAALVLALPAVALADDVSLQVSYEGQPSQYRIDQKYTELEHGCVSQSSDSAGLIWDSDFVGSLPDKAPPLTSIPGRITLGLGAYNYMENVTAWDDSATTCVLTSDVKCSGAVSPSGAPTMRIAKLGKVMTLTFEATLRATVTACTDEGFRAAFAEHDWNVFSDTAMPQALTGRVTLSEDDLRSGSHQFFLDSKSTAGQAPADCSAASRRRIGGDQSQLGVACTQSLGYAAVVNIVVDGCPTPGQPGADEPACIKKEQKKKFKNLAKSHKGLAGLPTLFCGRDRACRRSVAQQRGVDRDLAAYYAALAKDPPDKNFRKVAKPRRVRLRGGRRAIRSFTARYAKVLSLGRAMLTSVERAQGAALAKDVASTKLQTDAAYRYERSIERVLRGQRKASRRLGRRLGRRFRRLARALASKRRAKADRQALDAFRALRGL